MGFRTVEEVNGRRRSLELYAVNHTTNLLCLRAPYYYLQAWLDRDSLPPREIAFPHEPEMSFEGELYEIVNSHPDNRLRPSGILYGIPLEGIAATLDQWQDYFSGAFRPKHIIPALNSGLRGNDLIPALLRDFKVWQTCPTDRWVKTDSSPFPPFGMQVLQPSANAGQWQNLPTEVIIEIFSNLSFYRILSLTSSCRYLYYNFGNPSFLSVLLRRFLCLPYSQAYWFLPVPAVKGEVDKFSKACQESMPGVSLPNSQDVSIVFDPDFPLWEFFRANYTSDSMRNRRRLWRICRRFRRWWRHYRGGKWDEGSDDEDDYEEDSSSEESSDDDDDDEEDCSSTEESSDDD
ncbi:hypothetical protein CPB86DRAFT_361019 [Serendipita vermifera]|nr:hypothetical protein CPB86DRAFT_361019 [Serendipita vermifera]